MKLEMEMEMELLSGGLRFQRQRGAAFSYVLRSLEFSGVFTLARCHKKETDAS